MYNNATRQLFIDFDIFCRALIVTKDVDPVYPLLNEIRKLYGFESFWFAFCYVAFYNLESGIKMCEFMPTAASWDEEQFVYMRNGTKKLTKFGHERRGNIRNVDNQIKMFDVISKHLTPHKPNVFNFESNQTFRQSIQDNIPFHGGWAAFKIAEIMEKSFGYNELKIYDLGLDGRDPNRDDSPVGGLKWLYGKEHTYDVSWFEEWNKFGAKLAKAYNTDIGVIETCLCKFHKFKTGKYYIGHDIDEFHELQNVLGRTNWVGLMTKIFQPKLWFNGQGVRKELKAAYSDSGTIINAEFANKLKSVDVFDILIETTI